ncbi:MAG: hypothetical protein WB697_18325 [Stellaceae bacterium]
MTQKRPRISADQARGGDIVLHRGWERIVFIAGLGGAVVLGLVFVVWSY